MMRGIDEEILNARYSSKKDQCSGRGSDDMIKNCMMETLG
jgi:hypothetical protein